MTIAANTTALTRLYVALAPGPGQGVNMGGLSSTGCLEKPDIPGIPSPQHESAAPSSNDISDCTQFLTENKLES